MLFKNFKILGLDISTRSTGWSVIEYVDEDKYKLIDYGIIERHGMDIGEMLVFFEQELMNIIRQYQPHGISAEAPFVGKNRQTVQKLDMFHGVMQLIAKKEKLQIAYYAVMTLKSKVLGGMKVKRDDGTRKTGAEMKQEVAEKIFSMLGKENFVKEYNDDVTDSISAGIVYCIMKGKDAKAEKEEIKFKEKSSKRKKKEVKE